MLRRSRSSASRPVRRTWGTVRLRMTLAAALVVTIAMGSAALLLVASVRTSLRDDIRAESELALAEARVRIERGNPLDRIPPPAVQGFAILVMDRNGRIIGGSPGYGSGRWADFVGKTADDYRDVVGENGEPFPAAITGEHHVWFVGDRVYDFVEIRIGRAPAYLVAAGPIGAIEQSVRTLETTLWWAVPGLVLLVGIIAWGVTGRALRPVELIRSEVTAITHSRLDRRVSEPRAQDEVGRLAHTMNEMLDRLQDSSDRQRQFLSDASHELRSPVAAMRATGEVALAHPESADWPQVVRRMLAEDERMEQIVTELLDLAREQEPSLPDTPVDLDDIVLEEVARARLSGADLSCDGVSGGRVRGSHEQLARVVRNLLDNATRHATRAVRISLRSEDDVVLTVEDDGAGIAPDDRERVFERFTRLDDGRARDRGGLGIGLAMVRSMVERHGGTVAVTDSTDSEYPGARIVVQLPAAD